MRSGSVRSTQGRCPFGCCLGAAFVCTRVFWSKWQKRGIVPSCDGSVPSFLLPPSFSRIFLSPTLRVEASVSTIPATAQPARPRTQKPVITSLWPLPPLSPPSCPSANLRPGQDCGKVARPCGPRLFEGVEWTGLRPPNAPSFCSAPRSNCFFSTYTDCPFRHRRQPASASGHCDGSATKHTSFSRTHRSYIISPPEHQQKAAYWSARLAYRKTTHSAQPRRRPKRVSPRHSPVLYVWWPTCQSP